MNRHLLILPLALVAASSAVAQSGLFSGPFSGGNYTTISGGSFEIGDSTAGWHDHLNVAGVVSVLQPTMRGDRVGEMSGWSVGWYATNHDVTSLVVGRRYVLSAFLGAPDTGGSIAFDIGNYGGQAWYQTAGVALELTTATTDRWFFGYTTFIADNPNMKVRLVRNGPTIPYARNYFDDVAITEADTFRAPGVVPEPATMIALGAGVLALIRRRRAN